MSQPGYPSGLPNQQQAQRGVAVEKPKSDIYTVMLIIALISILCAIGLLSSELSKYDWDFKPQGTRPKVQVIPTAPRDTLVAFAAPAREPT
jgi:hypothetical protein